MTTGSTIYVSEFSPASISDSPQAGAESLPWTLIGIGEAGRRLYLDVGVGGGCETESHRLVVREGKDYVWVGSAEVSSLAPGDDSCAAVLDMKKMSVDLHDPLGTRTLIHAPLGRIGDTW